MFSFNPIKTWVAEYAVILLLITNAVTGLYSVISYFRIDAYQSDLKVAQVDVASAAAAVEKVTKAQGELDTSVKNCQAGITAIDKRASDLQVKNDALEVDLKKKQAPKVQRTIQYIQQPRPAGMSACDNAERLLNEEITQRASAAVK